MSTPSGISHKSWPHFLRQPDRWNPLLLKAKISPGMWSRHDETIPPEPLTGF
jgi:hypothetical protein